jgi:hypothetical protein
MAVLRAGLKQVTIYIPDQMYEALRHKAFAERTSTNKLVTAAIEALLRESPPPRIVRLGVPGSTRRRSGAAQRPVKRPRNP